MQPEAYLNFYGSLPKIIGRKPNRIIKIPLDESAPLSDKIMEKSQFQNEQKGGQLFGIKLLKNNLTY